MAPNDIETAIEKADTRVTVGDHTEGSTKVVLQRDGDLALGVYELDVTEDEVARVDRKKLLRKIDFHLIPIVKAPPNHRVSSTKSCRCASR